MSSAGFNKVNSGSVDRIRVLSLKCVLFWQILKKISYRSSLGGIKQYSYDPLLWSFSTPGKLLLWLNAGTEGILCIKLSMVVGAQLFRLSPLQSLIRVINQVSIISCFTSKNGDCYV